MLLRHRHPFLEPHEQGQFLGFAHRGGTRELPENSMAAFRAAHSLGYRYLETDVHATKDGDLVAFHDSNLSRTCGTDREISSMTVQEIQRERIDGREPIPLLSELLEEFPDSYVNIDAKSDDCVLPLIDFLRRSNALDRVCVGSFSHRRLRTVRSVLGEEVCTSASPVEVAMWMLGVIPSGPSCVQIPTIQSGITVATENRIARSEQRGIPVHIWTVDDPREMQSLIDIGVHGIMTDECHILRSVAEQNMIWS